MLSRACLVPGFVVLAIMTMDLLQIPLTAFAFIFGAVAIGDFMESAGPGLTQVNTLEDR
jgi:hypothetical protein